ncbi:uncharacterized protein LOC111886047 [Lactuca sativa]|uniref:uncharacterized protein LOC111886047 n=1 Tax=Lactuca sativa TaxID=4236 RepID=UPI000CC9D27C|nr:uncharacterized protein LOC111886047 [Lactuca sativa]
MRSVEDVEELMQHIQSRLPVEEAARTSVLSKSWLHAWSTIPTLRFHVDETKHLNMVDCTLSRYLRDNIPIERLELDVDINDVESSSLAEKWIRSVVASSSLKELSLSVSLTGASLTLPDEILSAARNLTKLRVTSASRQGVHSVWMKSNSIMNCVCVSLREVVLSGVRLSQEVLDAIFSSCSFLEKIDIYLDKQEEGRGRSIIKIKNLARLHEIRIYSHDGDSTDLEISGVPNLRLFRCNLFFGQFGRPDPRPFSAYSISLGSSVTELWLGGLITDESSLEMIKSGFPFLESLTLDMRCWTLGIFHFTCESLKTLSLMWSSPRRQIIDIQIYAPKLLDFIFVGYTLPSFKFPNSTLLVQTKFVLTLDTPLDASFFLKMREALTLSAKCHVSITIKNYKPSLDIDLVDLRTRLLFPPANNVQQLEFQMVEAEDECRTPFFDAFFEICHPKHVFAKPEVASGHTNHFFQLMLREVLEKKKTTRRNPTPYWPSYLKHVRIRRHHRWETLTNSHRTFLDEPTDFKLNWR